MISFLGRLPFFREYLIRLRGTCQASNSIFAEKTSIQRRGKRPSFPWMVNSPRETRVAKKPRYNWGVNEYPSFSMPSQSLSGPFLTHQAPHYACPRVTRPARDTTKSRHLLASMTGMSYPSPADPRDGKFLTRDKEENEQDSSVFLDESLASRAPRILSLLQKLLPGAVAITLPRSGWKILHATRVTHENTLPDDGVSGLPRLLRPHLRAHSPHHQTRGTRDERMPRPFGSPISLASPASPASLAPFMRERDNRR